MSYAPRTHRRRQKRRSRQLQAAVVAFGLVAVGGTIAVLQATGEPDSKVATANGAGVKSDTGLRRLTRPAAGRPLTVTTPEGYSYTLEGVRIAPKGDAAASGGTASPGASHAYVEYILTNSGRDRALLDFPADLFMRDSAVPASVRDRCGHRAGARHEMCEVPNRHQIMGGFGDSKAPEKDELGATYIPAGSSYLVRSVTEFPMTGKADEKDFGLYVLNVRFTGDRIPRQVPFPT